MRSAVRWYEDAVTGKLERQQAHKALDRAVRESRNGAGLPAGLWTLSRHGLASQAVWSGVPIRLAKAGVPPDEGPADLRADAGLPKTLATIAARKQPASVRLVSALSQPRGMATARSPTAALSAMNPQRGGVVSRRGQEAAAMAAPMIAGPRMTAASRSAARVAAATPGLAEQAAVIRSAALAAPTTSASTRSAALRAAVTTSAPGTTYAGAAAVGIGGPSSGSAVRPLGMPVGSRTGVSPASSGNHAPGPAGAVLRAMAETVRLGPGGVPAGTTSAPSSWSAALTDGLAGGQPGSQDVMSSLQSRIGVPAGRSGFGDQAVGGRNIVPRRAGAPARNGDRIEAREADQQAVRTSMPVRAGSGGGTSAMAADRGSSGVGQTAHAGTQVSLHGDVMLDGRKMGRMVASGQTSAASLPTVSASAVNLRAMPVFTGTRIPL